MKNNTSKVFFLIFLLLCFIVPTTCMKLEKVMLVSTGDVTSIAINTAEASGEIIDIGDGATQRGHCYAKNPNVNMDGPKTELGAPTGPGGFTSKVINLEAGTKYYIKAYISNGTETIYGKEISFSTVSASLPTLTTNAITTITSTTASSGGNITSDGGVAITASGICWSTTSNPVATGSHTTDGAVSGVFTSIISGLTANTTYFLRAYATNSVGTAYGNELSFITLPISTGTVTDIDGNVYNIVTIGTQAWMKENLKTTKYNDGTAIPNITDNNAWATLSTPSYCWYNNDATFYNTTYGALYNWFTVDAASNGGKNVCPTGWHLPSDNEWTILTSYLGGADVAGDKLKETGTTHWLTSNMGVTNETNFTALPGGSRDLPGGTFNYFGYLGYWWSSTEDLTNQAFNMSMYASYNGVYRVKEYKGFGLSIRCIKDN